MQTKAAEFRTWTQLTSKMIPTDHKLINLKDKNSGLFTVCGTIKWMAEKKTVNVKGTDKTVREGILADDTFSIPISVWEDNLLSELQEHKLYKLSPVSVRWFFGKRLATTVETTAEEIDSPPPEINWEVNMAKNLQEKPQSELLSLSCPTILNAEVAVYTLCTNSNCSKKVVPFPGEVTVRCNHCHKKMLVSNCNCDINANIEIEHVPKNITLTVFSNVLTKFFKEDVPTRYKNDKEALEDKILMMNNVDIKYNKKRVITSITTHPQDQ